MATLDNLLDSATVTVDGVGITISSLSSNEKAILTVALAALARTFDGGLAAGKAYGVDFGGVAGASTRHRVVVTPAAT